MRECLKHPWLTAWKNVVSHQRETISSESQRKNSGIHNGAFGGTGPGSPCPRSSAASAASINNGSSSSPSAAAAARSLQRAMSKSREVLYERVAASNLRKSTSKSRERLCEMKLSLSRSRDHLCDLLQPSAAQSRERLHSLRNLSKSHEVLSLLSGDQASGHVAPIHQSKLFQLQLTNPMTQSLECFTIPPLQDTKEMIIMARPADLTSLPTLVPAPNSSEPASASAECEDRLLSLSSALTESTETLCEQEQESTLSTSNQPECTDEITPSNSPRSATPTQQLKESKEEEPAASILTSMDSSRNSRNDDTIKVTPLMEEAEPTPMQRSDIVASCLKRLSRIGPPPVQVASGPSSLDSSASSVSSMKSPWNWPIHTTTNVVTSALSTGSSQCASISPNPSLGSSSSRKSSLLSPVAPVTPKPLPTSPLPPPMKSASADSPDSRLSDKSFTSPITLNPPLPAPAMRLVETIPSTIATSTSSAVDTSSLTENQRQLLPSILNRRRASWAYGSKQEDVSSTTSATAHTAALFAAKKTEPKLSVSELISNFNQSKKIGDTTSSSSAASITKPSTVKKSSALSLLEKETVSPASSSTPSTSSSKVLAEREKAVFKPLSSSIQAFQKVSAANANTSTVLPTAIRNPAELPSRTRPHHFAWDVRALPRLPEDTVSSPPQEEATESIASAQQQPTTKDNTTTAAAAATGKGTKEKEKTATAPIDSACQAGFGLRSGSVSSDTGCSSSSDLSDRSSDECPDKDTQARRDGGRCQQDQEGINVNSTEESLTGPPASWQGRPRSFSVQSDISFLAQPWNRVCTGSVARAFEKFGTKVDGDVTVATSTATPAMLHRSRRQSTPVPFK